jgi:hypothetical protein
VSHRLGVWAYPDERRARWERDEHLERGQLAAEFDRLLAERCRVSK